MRDWGKLKAEVFSGDVFFAISSPGGKKEETSSKKICAIWENGFIGIDFVNHFAGNYLVKIEDNMATVFAYAIATHYNESAVKGKTREYSGTYHIRVMKHGIGCGIYQIKYDLKFVTGNIDLI